MPSQFYRPTRGLPLPSRRPPHGALAAGAQSKASMLHQRAPAAALRLFIVGMVATAVVAPKGLEDSITLMGALRRKNATR